MPLKHLSCNHCDDDDHLVIADGRGEWIEKGETPLEHMKRTGHSPRKPVMYQCNNCGNVWPYSGDSDRPTCSNCRGKAVEPAE